MFPCTLSPLTLRYQNLTPFKRVALSYIVHLEMSCVCASYCLGHVVNCKGWLSLAWLVMQGKCCI